MQYGYFDDERREYTITDPRTPVTWINYLGTLAFGGFIDQTGGLLICKDDPALNRITKYIPQLPASSFKGATLYLRTPRPQGGYRVFSPFYVPTLDPYQRYECHAGLGYSRFITRFYGIESEIVAFVPPEGGRLIYDIRVTNRSDASLTVDAIPVVEYTHPDALKQFTNADWVPQTMQSRAVVEEDGCTVLLQYPFMYRDLKVNVFTGNRPATSYETDRRHFLGDNEFGTWGAPAALQQPALGNHEALRGDNIAALLHPLGTLAPGTTERLIVQLTQAPSLDEARPGLAKYRRPEAVDGAFARLAAFWDDYLSAYQVTSPERRLDQMLNVHNPHQCHTTLNWSRYLSLYQPGLGARGIGFRDSSQDILGVLAGAPRAAKRLLRQLLHVQKADGSAMHQFNPLTMIANEGDSREVEGAPNFYSDDHLWGVLAVCAYLKETGDFAFLDEQIPYYGRGFYEERRRRGEPALDEGRAASSNAYTKNDEERAADTLAGYPVWDHLARALAFTRSTTGAHGLPLAGFADWNDTVNLAAGAESLFTANLYGRALQEMIELARHLAREEAAAAWETEYELMQERVNEQAWDGEWYVRYFDHDGTPLGARENEHGQIYANAQSSPVLSGFAPPERARRALDAVYDRLNTAYGIRLSAPGFDGFDPGKGGVTTYPPGAKENGGIFLHANPWVIIAETMLGNGDRAYAYYQQINPATRNDQIEQFEAEPYVYPQNILAPPHPRAGLARNSWLTGTASWAYQAGTQWILGIRPAYSGLVVEPCIPAAWDGFRVRRRFRDATYDIHVRNPQHVSRGVVAVEVDGALQATNLLPVFNDGEIHEIVVTLGAAS